MTTITQPRQSGAARRVRVSQARVLLSEWTKFRSLRSTAWTMLVTVVLTIGLGAAISAGRAARWAQTNPAERLRFDPTITSLSGVFLAQLAIGVLGVLVITGEYSTGQIRSSLTAVPRRLPVLWAKAMTFGVVSLAVTTLTCLAAFALGQRLLASTGHATALGDPGVTRAVFGAALYLTVVGLLGLGLGALLRNTAGAISALVALLLVVPILANFLPSNWQAMAKYLPSNAGQSILAVRPDPTALSPWIGMAVFAGYAVVVLAAGAVLLVRRDA